MRKVKVVEVTRTREITESYTCDKCGKDLLKLNSYTAFDPAWFELKTGSAFPEGGSGEYFRMDLCEECSKDLVELLISNGYQIRTEDWDY